MMRGRLLGWRACKFAKNTRSYLMIDRLTGRLTDSPRSMIILATIFLNIGHPGLIFESKHKDPASVVTDTPASVKNEQYSSSDETRENSSAAV
jgi:hypothetical protein